MFASCYVKDYTIQLDGKPYTIKNERWLGVVNKENGENYFEGSVFDYDEKSGSYSMGSSVTKTKAEFDNEVERVTFFK